MSLSIGTPPYSFSWTPTTGLDDPLRQNPLARPATTTTYDVSVSDPAGTTSAGSVTVSVIPALPPPTASFVYSVRCCPFSVFLDASASTGDIVSYTWDLSWTSTSPDGVTTGPTAQFPIREIDFGTITLTVTDSLGRTATTTRRRRVTESPPAAAIQGKRSGIEGAEMNRTNRASRSSGRLSDEPRGGTSEAVAPLNIAEQRPALPC